MVTDWEVTTKRDQESRSQYLIEPIQVSIRTVDIDLGKNEQPQDFGEEFLVGTYVGADEDDWAERARTIAAAPNMLAILKMLLERPPDGRERSEREERRMQAAYGFAERAVRFVEKG